MVICLAATVAVADNLMSIQIKKGQLRTMPVVLGKIIADLNYASRLPCLTKGSLDKSPGIVKNVEGWLHASALTSKQSSLNPVPPMFPRRQQ